MTFVKQYLGREVFGGTAKGVRAGLAILGETKIGQFKVTLFVDEDVLGLKITVDNVLLMEVLKHERDLSRVEHGVV